MTNSPFHPDDPRLTAYALGELDSADAALLQLQLQSDAALRAHLADIQSSVAAVSTHLAAEPALHLTASQHAALSAPPARSAASFAPLIRPVTWTSRLWLATGLAAAACVGFSALIARNDQTSGGRDFSINRDAERLHNKEVLAYKLDSSAPSADARLRDELRLSIPVDQSNLSPKESANLSAEYALADSVSKFADGSISTLESAKPELQAGFAGSSLTKSVDELKDKSAALDSAAAPARPDAAEQAQSQPRSNTASPADSAKKEEDRKQAPSAGDAPEKFQRDKFSPELAARLAQESNEATRRAMEQNATSTGAPPPPPSPQIPRAAGQGGAPVHAPGSGGGRSNDGNWSTGNIAPGVTSINGIQNREVPTRTQLQILFGGDDDRHDGVRGRALTPANESYNAITDNPFIKPEGSAALSTFGFETDSASYSNARRFLRDGQLPPADSVRIEELVNYFNYSYPAPPSSSEQPLAIYTEVAPAPWAPTHKLLRVGLKAREINLDNRPATNLVFLVDVSGSMASPDKLPLLKESLKLLVNRLNGDDRLAIVTYAGNAGIAMGSRFLNDKPAVITLIDSLQAGGSTAGAQGIQTAYDVASDGFIQNGVNRVILCTDGDFNVGISNDSDLVRFIEDKRKSNIYLSVLGFGTGNLKDAKMEQLADHGNGTYGYIDSLSEARRIFVNNMAGSLVTVVKDVKTQVVFNPGKVAAYRQIGYENRALAPQDFEDPTKDAGEIGAGQSVTALYEIIPVGQEINVANVDLIYQKPAESQPTAVGGNIELVPSNDLCTVKVRYKLPDAPEPAPGLAAAPANERTADTALGEPTAGRAGGASPNPPVASAPDQFAKNIAPAQADADSASGPAGKSPATEVEKALNRADDGPNIVHTVPDESLTLEKSSPDFRFAASVASFGMLLRDSPYKGNATFAAALELAQSALGSDPDGFRAEFIDLLDRARRLKGQ